MQGVLGSRSALRSVLAVVLLVGQIGAVPAMALVGPGEVATGGDLDLLLLRMSRVASLYKDAVLRFSCREKIKDRGLGGRTHEFRYIYVYDEKGGFEDYRTHVKKGSTRELELKEVGVPQFLRRSYSWAFVFSGAEQALHRYELRGEERVLDRDAIKIWFEPIPPHKAGVNDWYGTAWIDRDDYQLLRVQAVHLDDWPEYRRFLSDRARLADGETKERYGAARDFGVVTTDFDIEKNGLRLPWRTLIVRGRYRARANRDLAGSLAGEDFRVTQTYSGCQFFSVRSRHEIRAFVMGENPD